MRKNNRNKEGETLTINGGGNTPDVVFVKKTIGEMEVWVADVRERGTKYTPNPYPPVKPGEKKQK